MHVPKNSGCHHEKLCFVVAISHTIWRVFPRKTQPFTRECQFQTKGDLNGLTNYVRI